MNSLGVLMPRVSRLGLSLLGLAALASCVEPAAPLSPELPTQVGQCGQSTVVETGARLMGTDPMQSGSAIRFANGGFQVGYDYVHAASSSRIGDPVKICLIEIPQGCPPGDDRGRVYTTTNLRTGAAWTMADASHICGGA